MERIDYNIADRDTTLAALIAAGRNITADSTTNLVNGVLHDCYCMVDDAPAVPPDDVTEK